ncbi:glycoside hydrolase family 32 protein [Arenibacter palladensis]|uniref:glycoside hydrolase family 32 protein n=1 Tax=Arenibacter palladensis TaxID=237373 RepID=UPI0026E2A36C|nr:glycoside hydrolase family 32 protein [Arenibacter palladensis]MDO6602845.1 glycoside hydrolase family 32 protein [Arenibacter palladensis]
MKKINIIIILIFSTVIINSAWSQDDVIDYTSKVPKFKFANTLKQQLKQLETNPLMLRFAESRKKMKDDRYRPYYHFVSPEGNLNDPNGLSYWQGRWHLFYQAYPPEDTRQHWGHAVSDDLIHWSDLPYAIYPGPEYQCYSGATLVEEDRVIAMYHGTRLGNMVAVSEDPLLLNWKKIGEGAVIPMTPNSKDLPYDVYDPNIWKKDGMYYSMSGGITKDANSGNQRVSSYLFKSKDLENWDYMHKFIENDYFTQVGDDGACPYFWPIGDKYILPFFSHISGGQYFLGDYDMKRDKFVVTSHDKFNFGPTKPAGIHAPSAAPAPNSKDVIVIFNMNDAKPTEGWNQIMSLPRRLSLQGNDTLMQSPAGDLKSLRYNKKIVKAQTIPANQEIVFRDIQGDAMEIELEIDAMEAPMVELNVLRSPNKKEFTRIAFYKDRGMWQGRNYDRPRPKSFSPKYNSLLTLDTSYSSLLPDVKSRAPETGSFYLKPGETLKLRVFIDRSVVEVFANGKLCLATRVYPGREDSVGVSIGSMGRDVKLLSFEAYQMKNIYMQDE